ncbi:hypothetical protein [Streptomyces sp. NPDC002215]|uniref:hypothetical protein n=1 Tax=Streptomyces sp. NPDC002215 TaxID=3154412 RepID=UPI0033201EF1
MDGAGTECWRRCRYLLATACGGGGGDTAKERPSASPARSTPTAERAAERFTRDRDVSAHRSDVFVHAGAARAARTLAATSYAGPRMAMHTAMGARFLMDAGDAAESGEFISPCVGATAPAAKEFTVADATRA